MHITLTNADPHKEIELNLELRAHKPANISGTVLTAKELSQHNTFDNPEVVKSVAFKGFKLSKETVSVKLPAASVVMMEL